MTLALVAEFPIRSIKILMPEWINEELSRDDIGALHAELLRVQGVVDVVLSTGGWIELNVDLAILPDRTAEIAHICNERRKPEIPSTDPG